MLDFAYWLATLAVFAVPIAALTWARGRFELEPLWYGLAFVGACAAILTMLGVDVLTRLYIALTGLGPVVDREGFFSSWHALLFFPLTTGLLVEALKSRGILLFHTSFTRTRWPLYAASVGAGAGLLEALLVVGSTAWSTLVGGVLVTEGELWLSLQFLAKVPMHAALCALALYWAAQGKWLAGWFAAGCSHALLLFSLQWLHYRQGFDGQWLGAAVFGLGCAAVAAVIYGLAKKRGWPM